MPTIQKRVCDDAGVLIFALRKLRVGLDGAWMSLLRALHPALASISELCPDLAETIREAEGESDLAWSDEVATLKGELAQGISDAVAEFSERLSSAYQCAKPETRAALRDAIGFAYVDVLRPLWAAHPHLRPSEMAHPGSTNDP